MLVDSEIREWLHSMDIYDYDICDGVVHVVGSVKCFYNELKFIPVQFGYVSGDFICEGNNLVSLYGCPSEVGGDFFCSFNKLESLKGGPSEVGGDFVCSHNQLESLKGCPNEVMKYFDCSGNNLTSLEGGPKIVDGNYYCHNNLFKDKPDVSGIKIGCKFVWK
jgi:Leucine-rich repeat (LRR) protein